MYKTITVAIVFNLAALLSSGHVNAGEWDLGIGVSYVSGISDVTDIYEDNLETDAFVEVDVVSIPVGAGLMARYRTESGIIVDLGVGPAFLIAGDASHQEIPFSATVGYSFLPGGEMSPYIRFGVVSHYVDGDYVESSEAGNLVAIGMEFNRDERSTWGIELSTNDSTVEFEDLTRAGNTEINSYDQQLTLFILF